MSLKKQDAGLLLPRRSVLHAGLAAAGALLTPALQPNANAQGVAGEQERKRSARIAHLTDVHVQPEHAGDRGFAACLRHVQANAKPDLVLFGGDGVFDVNKESPDRTRSLATMWRTVLRDELSIPSFSAIGNHDVPDAKALIAAKADEQSTKAWACDLYGLQRRYFGFDRFGWHFVVLDSVRFGGPYGYAGRLDDEQLDWLKADLAAAAAAKKPVLVMSHLPIVSVVGFFDGDRLKRGDWDVPRSYMHVDAIGLHELFVTNGNVRLCISGHAHQADFCKFDGVDYACNGAVCGDWWKGDYHHTPPGYALIDLFTDGTCELKYHSFGWTAVP